jgi:hypothetical protein
MRALTALFLLVGLTLLGWGMWMLYARFIGGPEYYMGRPDETSLRKIDESLADLRRKRAETDVGITQARAMAEKLPPGDATREKSLKRLDEMEKSRAESESVVARAEEMRDKVAQRVAADWEDARGRTLRRGVLFTLVGLFWSVRAAGSLRRSTPST